MRAVLLICYLFNIAKLIMNYQFIHQLFAFYVKSGYIYLHTIFGDIVKQFYLLRQLLNHLINAHGFKSFIIKVLKREANTVITLQLPVQLDNGILLPGFRD